MSQWQQIQTLAKIFLDRVDCLYSDDCIPMEVRQYLAYWIEEQNWSQAAQSDPSLAYCLLHTMLSLLDDQLGRLVLGEENNANMVLKHNLRRSKLYLQRTYQEHPQELANAIDGLLRQERAILSEASSASQSSVEPPCDSSVATIHHHKIEERLMEMHKTIQGLKCSIEQLGDLQDAFHFCYTTHMYLERTSPAADPTRTKNIENLQNTINKVDHCRKEMLDRIQEVLGRSDTLRGLLLEEVVAWQDRQQLACIGKKCNTSLRELEEWFTKNAEDLFHLLHLLKTLDEMCQKLTYEGDLFKVQLPLLEKRLQEQIICLLKSAFVVEVQPKMSISNQRPLVLKTNCKFSVRASLLVKLLDRNHSMEVKIDIDRDATKLARFRKFNIMTSNTKTLIMETPQAQRLICDFKHIMLREQKISGSGKGNKGISEGLLPVTEELHVITFTLDYCYQGLKCQLQTSTLPVLIVSNANQMSSAWASVLWFIMLSTDLKNQMFFSKPPPATWSQLSTVLSWQFSAATEQGLNPHQLKMLGEKLCGSGVTSHSTITWAQFSKESIYSCLKDNTCGFSFWTWIDGILLLIQEHLLQLWKENLIMGFVSQRREKSLLKRKKAGTFLLRFSESTNGGITFTWVEFNNNGSPKFNSVEPYTKEDLKDLSLPEIIQTFQLMAEAVVPENPLLYLYPDIPRDEAFGPYCSEYREANTVEQAKYLKRRLIRVSSKQSGEAQTANMDELLPVNNMLVTSDLENLYNVEDILLAKQDPFLSQLSDEQQMPQGYSELFTIPELSLDGSDFQFPHPLENTSSDNLGNENSNMSEVDDLLNLMHYAKMDP